MKKVLAIGIAVCFTAASWAQQDAQFSQFMHNRLNSNPGVAGSNNAICATVLGRMQWMGFSGKPESILLSVHSPLKMLHGGVGVNIYKDRVGGISTFNVKLDYAYRLNIGTGALGLGIGLGILNETIHQFSNDQATDGIDNDPSINNGALASTTFDLDLGVYYKTDKLYIGISALHVPGLSVSAGDGEADYTNARHYYIMAGYDYEFKGLPLTLSPSILVKSDASSTQLDINVTATYNNLVWLGVSYRVADAVVPMIGFKKDNIGPGTLKVGFAYDITTSNLNQYSSGSIEAMLGYCFNLPDDNKVQKHKTVRFL